MLSQSSNIGAIILVVVTLLFPEPVSMEEKTTTNPKQFFRIAVQVEQPDDDDPRNWKPNIGIKEFKSEEEAHRKLTDLYMKMAERMKNADETTKKEIAEIEKKVTEDQYAALQTLEKINPVAANYWLKSQVFQSLDIEDKETTAAISQPSYDGFMATLRKITRQQFNATTKANERFFRATEKAEEIYMAEVKKVYEVWESSQIPKNKL
jgi:hypothetical protein